MQNMYAYSKQNYYINITIVQYSKVRVNFAY